MCEGQWQWCSISDILQRPTCSNKMSDGKSCDSLYVRYSQIWSHIPTCVLAHTIEAHTHCHCVSMSSTYKVMLCHIIHQLDMQVTPCASLCALDHSHTTTSITLLLGRWTSTHLRIRKHRYSHTNTPINMQLTSHLWVAPSVHLSGPFSSPQKALCSGIAVLSTL